MSTFGKTNSNLPEDIEERIAAVQTKISLLERNKIDLESAVETKRKEASDLDIRISAARTELEKLLADHTDKILALEEREKQVASKESALNVYANALKEKEEKINKYLSIFENMKNVIGK